MPQSEIMQCLINIVAKRAVIPVDHICEKHSFQDLGIDSMLLIDMVESINKQFSIQLSISDYIVVYNTLESIEQYVIANQTSNSAELHIHNENKNKADLVPVASVSHVQGDQDNVGLMEVIQSQRVTMERIFAKQLETIELVNRTLLKKDEPVTGSLSIQQKEAQNSFKPFTHISAEKKQYHPDMQSKVDLFISGFNQKTSKSKQIASQYRAVLADADEIAGFNLFLKEMHYQITVKRASGSRIVDMDNNEYLDIAMGFGALLLGHMPDFLYDALTNEIERGMQLSPKHRLLGSVSEKIKAITGFDRVTYTATGTESVITAVRIARTYTNRHKIVVFTGCYHGHADSTLVTLSHDGSVIPIAPGITQSTVKDTIVLIYNDLSSIDIIEKKASEIACILVEPVQSRRPDIVPIEFLASLRKVSKKHGIVLIFDEIITGFRCHLGGAISHFGIRSDLATYAKAICNGMPMGVVAGDADIMDAMDGGVWQFGDLSYPSKRHTYMGGTFFKHPFSLAAADVILSHLQESGTTLQQTLSQRTHDLCKALNDLFVRYKVGIHCQSFSSLFKFFARSSHINMDLFFALLLGNNVFTWSGRTCFLSTAHTDDDICFIVEAVDKTLAEFVKITNVSVEDELDGFIDGVPDKVFLE